MLPPKPGDIAVTQVDLLVLGGTVVTMNQAREVIENGGVAVKAGKIVAVGSRAEISAKYVGRQTSMFLDGSSFLV